MTDIRYSQNYMKNSRVVRSLVERSGIGKNDYVIEIGPGKGMITEVLAEFAQRVTAVEYDKILYERLIGKNHLENVEYIHGDFLKYALPWGQDYKIFSNIPFQITADIMRKITEGRSCPGEIFLIMQKEAAKKYCGIPKQKYEGLRASLLKVKYEARIVYDFERSDFYPAPDVDIVLLHLKKKKTALAEKEYEEYRDLVSYFYTCNRGNAAGDCLLALFTKEQVKRLAKSNRISLSESYTKITAGQWEGIYFYAKTGLAPEKRAKAKGAYHRLSRQQKRLKKQNRTMRRKSSG